MSSSLLHHFTRVRVIAALSLLVALLYYYIRPLTVPKHTLVTGRHQKSDRYFFNRGFSLFYRCWKTQSPSRGVVFLLHGFGEYSGRYHHVADALVKGGLDVYALDHIGHGESDGDRAHITDFREYVEDAFAFFSVVERKRNEEGRSNANQFLIGHSMGGTIALTVAMESQDRWKGVILSGPAIVPDPKVSTPFLKMLARYLNGILPKLPAGEKIDPKLVSRDPRVIEAYDNDPLNYHGRMRVGWGYCMMQAMEALTERLDSVCFPFLLLHGKNDGLTLPEGSELMHRRAASADKEIHLFDGCAHEIFNEPEKDEVIARAVEWIDKRA